ncbi:MAG: PAS domain-containing protein [Desulfomonile tiedjei]|nr:PAS domain-containing protein [Desulfomonile tiedjei]
MTDDNKNRGELIRELEELRQLVSLLQARGADAEDSWRRAQQRGQGEPRADEFAETREFPDRLLRTEERTETIDLGALFTKEITDSGSFDIRGGIWATTFGKVLQALPIPAMVLDQSGKVTVANEASGRISTDYESILGSAFSDLFPNPAVSERVGTLVEEVFSTRKARVGEGIIQIKESRVWARMTFRAVRIALDRFVLVLVEDLTAEKKQLQIQKRLRRELEGALVTARKLQAEADAANRAKSNFLASMSHELRTPLNAIIGFSQIMQGQTTGNLNEHQLSHVNDIFDAGLHLLDLINDILDLEKVESGTMELRLSGVSLRGLLESSLVMIREQALKRGLALGLSIPDELAELPFRVDEIKFKQIMFNLLSNAVKFTPDGGRINVAVTREGDRLVFTVSDTGIGLAPHDQARIFDEFVQVNSSYARREQGTGLGLALTRNLVQLHGGGIWVESDGLGKGSKFFFSIPLETQQEP